MAEPLDPGGLSTLEMGVVSPGDDPTVDEEAQEVAEPAGYLGEHQVLHDSMHGTLGILHLAPLEETADRVG